MILPKMGPFQRVHLHRLWHLARYTVVYQKDGTKMTKNVLSHKKLLLQS